MSFAGVARRTAYRNAWRGCRRRRCCWRLLSSLLPTLLSPPPVRCQRRKSGGQGNRFRSYDDWRIATRAALAVDLDWEPCSLELLSGLLPKAQIPQARLTFSGILTRRSLRDKCRASLVQSASYPRMPAGARGGGSFPLGRRLGHGHTPFCGETPRLCESRGVGLPILRPIYEKQPMTDSGPKADIVE